MSYRHTIANITTGHIARDVQNAPILNVRTLADADFMHIAAHIHTKPDIGIFPDLHIARNAGISLFWGCNDESIVSIAAALHAAYACPNTRYLDLDGSFDLVEDLLSGGFTVKDGYMEISQEPGLGLHRKNR